MADEEHFDELADAPRPVFAAEVAPSSRRKSRKSVAAGACSLSCRITVQVEVPRALADSTGFCGAGHDGPSPMQAAEDFEVARDDVVRLLKVSLLFFPSSVTDSGADGQLLVAHAGHGRAQRAGAGGDAGVARRERARLTRRLRRGTREVLRLGWWVWIVFVRFWCCCQFGVLSD